MSFEVSLLSERLVTYLTLMWLLTRMLQHMLFEVSLTSEGPITYLTLVWFLASIFEGSFLSVEKHM